MVVHRNRLFGVAKKMLKFVVALVVVQHLLHKVVIMVKVLEEAVAALVRLLLGMLKFLFFKLYISYVFNIHNLKLKFYLFLILIFIKNS